MPNPTYPSPKGRWFDQEGLPTVIAQKFLSGLVGMAKPMAAVTVGASPFAYTASAPGTLWVVGGTVSAVTIKRATATLASGVTSGGFTLAKGDIATVTYTVMPALTFVPS